jgi:hypothetical protein
LSAASAVNGAAATMQQVNRIAFTKISLVRALQDQLANRDDG